MGRRATALLTAIAIVAVTAGCGDGDDSAGPRGGDDGTASAPAREFVSKANAICGRRKRELAEDLLAYSAAFRKRNPDKRAAADAFPGGLRGVGLPGLRVLIEELREIEAADEAAARTFLDSFEKAVEAARRRPRIDEAQFQRDFAESRELAQRYGVDDCAFGG